MFVCCECCVLSGRGLCDGLITRSEESCRMWRVVVCDQETLKNEEDKARNWAVKYTTQWAVTPGKQTNKHIYSLDYDVFCASACHKILVYCVMAVLLSSFVSVVGFTSRFVCVVCTFSLSLVCDSVSVWPDSTVVRSAPTLPGPWSSCQVFFMAFVSPSRHFQRSFFIQAFHSRWCVICIM